MYLGLRRSKQTEIIIYFKRSMDDSVASFSDMNDGGINN